MPVMAAAAHIPCKTASNADPAHTALVRVLSSVASALWPSIPPGHPLQGTPGAVVPEGDDYWRLPGDWSPVVMQQVLSNMEAFLPESLRLPLLMLLRFLQTRLGTFILCGHHALSMHFPFVLTFPEMSSSARQATLLAWSVSRLPQLRQAFRGLRGFILPALFTSTEAPCGGNHMWMAMGYTGPKGVPTLPKPPATVRAEKQLEAVLTDLQEVEAELIEGLAVHEQLRARGLPARAATQMDGQLVALSWSFEDGQQGRAAERALDAVIEVDAVVVGSGAGGGVAAACLAEAGMQVLVAEKSIYVPMARMSHLEKEAMPAMYEQAGYLTTADGAVSILAGSALGGGTKVNWAAALRTPDVVRREWSEGLGLTELAGPAFDEALDAVTSRLAVGRNASDGSPAANVQHNGQNAALLRCMAALTADVAEYPRNCSQQVCSSFCTLGCKHGHKQSSDITWLADAAATGNTHILTSAVALRVVHTANAASTAGDVAGVRRERRAAGVLLAVAKGPAAGAAGLAGRQLHVLVRSGIVISCAGSLHTPALLLRSKISVGGNVGRNLRLHPSTPVVVRFPSSQRLGLPSMPRDSALHMQGSANTLDSKRLPPATALPQTLLPVDACQGGEDGTAAGSAAAAGSALAGTYHSSPVATAEFQEASAAAAEDARTARTCVSGKEAGAQLGSDSCGSRSAQGMATASSYGSTVAGSAGSVEADGKAVDAGSGCNAHRGSVLLWDGPMMTAFSREVARWDDGGYGSLLTVAVAHPGLLGASLPWLSGAFAKEMVLAMKDAALLLVITRDKDGGRVSIDRQGRPSITYWPSSYDQESMLKGVEVLVRGAVAAGACQVAVLQAGPDAILHITDEERLQGIRPERLEAFLRGMRRRGIRKHDMAVLSAHQMSSACIGTSPSTSVCDPTGECWQAEGLYVCDASALPTCSGSNPMVTTEALAWLLMRKLAKQWRTSTTLPRNSRRTPVTVEYEEESG